MAGAGLDACAGTDRGRTNGGRATAPAGNAAYEGVASWSGELGYGVRAPERGQSAVADDTAEAAAVDAVAGEADHHEDAGH